MRFHGDCRSATRILGSLAAIAAAWCVSVARGDDPGAPGQPPAPQPPAPMAPGNAAAPAAPAGDAPTSGAPKAQVEAAEHDFKDVWSEEQLEWAFTIKNAGDAPLKISSVRPACGCTVAGAYPQEIAPGADGKFPFRLNTKNIKGKFTKAITVTTNDPANMQIHLTLTGQVKHPVDVDPIRGAIFGRVKGDTVISRKIVITNNTSESLNLTMDPKATSGCFQAELQEKDPGKVFELTITARPPYNTGLNRNTINLKTNFPNQQTIEVPCMAEVPQRIELRPDRIRVPVTAATGAPALPRRVSIVNNGDAPLKITSSKSSDEKITVEVKEAEPGVRYDVIVNIPTGYNPPENGALVTLATEDKEFPELKIPIESLAKPAAAGAEGGAADASKPKQPPAIELMKGKPAPQHAVNTQAGDALKLGPDSGKVQALVFYASWCGHCKHALPLLEQVYEKYADNKNVDFVAVNQDDREGARARTQDQTIEHYKSLNLKMPLVFDAEKSVARSFHVTGYPTMVVLDKAGVVQAVHIGEPAGVEKVLENEIDTLLADKSLADRMPIVVPSAVDPAGGVKPGTVAAPAAVDPAAPADEKGKSDGGK